MDTIAPRTASYWPADTSRPLLATTVGSVLRAAASQAPGQVALVAGTPDPQARREWRYGELLTEAERGARALLGRFDPGERIAVWAPSIPEWVLLEFAAGLAGLTLVTVNPAYGAEEASHVLGHSGASGVFLIPEYRGNSLPGILASIRPGLPGLREVISLDGWQDLCAAGDPAQRLPEADPGDPAQILYTSGTTGRPRAAVLCHAAITNNARLVYEVIGAQPGEAAVNPMPLFHIAGCGLQALGIAATLGTHVLMPHFDPALQLELIEAYRGACVGGVATMLHALVGRAAAGGHDLSSLRYALSGGAPVPPALARQVERTFGVPMLITFAQTESSCSITMTRATDGPDDRAGTVGRPLPQTEVRVADPATGETVAPGLPGEICTRGYLVMRGYLHDQVATAAAIDGDGWLHTGDVGSMDERGFCRIEGRIKEMIIRGGENIFPREIETVLASHDAVAEVAVGGVADRFWGEQVAAVIRPAAGAAPDPEELTAFCRGRLAPFKIPTRWEFVASFPLTASGKVRKNVLSEQLAKA